ncbi:MAG: amidohydrolase family protein, partial [bacterium]|nr:amidohydrolase family protein [bacterium]
MSKLILPGLIDPHVHLREPGNTQKEDFYTGTAAALAGGYTTIMDMPNNNPPATTLERLEEKISLAKKKIVCDVSFHFGSLGDNLNQFTKVKHKVTGLKLYLNETTGNFLIDKKLLEKIFITWYKNSSKPILLHAEDEAVQYVMKIVQRTGQKVHFC